MVPMYRFWRTDYLKSRIVPISLVMGMLLIGSGMCFWYRYEKNYSQAMVERTSNHVLDRNYRACQIFTVVNSVVKPSDDSPAPRAYSDEHTRPPMDYIELAEALSNNIGRDEPDNILGSALYAYTQSLASFGAAVSHHGSIDDVADFRNLVSITGEVVTGLCAAE